MKALSTNSNSESSRKTKKQDTPIESPCSENSDTPKEQVKDPLSDDNSIAENVVEPDDDRNDEIENLLEKVSTLSKALATVSEEKSKMEAAFQADRKLAIVRRKIRFYFSFLFLSHLKNDTVGNSYLAWKQQCNWGKVY